MNLKSKSIKLFFILAVFAMALSSAIGEEGMWTFDNPPVKQMKEKYGFAPGQKWLDHVQHSCVRFSDGGSGSMVSPNGLVMTNHHVAVFQLQKISTKERNYVATGFYAENPEQEVKCADTEVKILQSMKNVTERMKAAEKNGTTPKEKQDLRRKESAEIIKESNEETGLHSEMVNLYHGGEYWVYRYKKYTDVRLVMAPERQAAYFGGDDDNFTFPRWDLDMAFFRIYENDKPISNKHYLKINPEGAANGEMVFVPGHPGSTNRLYTNAQLLYQRNHQLPMMMDYIETMVRALEEYSAKGPEQQRRALTQLFGIANGRKAIGGMIEGLANERLIYKHRQSEKDLLNKVFADPKLKNEYATAWQNIENLLNANSDFLKKQFYHSLATGRSSRLISMAQTIVRYAGEIEKPDEERLPGFHEADLEGFRFRMFSPAPVYKDMEIAKLTATLQMALDALGDRDELLGIILQGRNPEDAAKELIEGTKLEDIELRKELIEDGMDAVEDSGDPLIKIALKLDPILREAEEKYREQYSSKISEESRRIAEARFAVYGKSIYPDANFTLRLSYGQVKGFPVNGTNAPYKTTLYGLYDRSLSFDQNGDYSLPGRFWERQKSLDLATPVNFISTNDIIGGNSGSPIINKDAEVVGLVFDGNIQSLPGSFIYDIEENRCVSVHSAYIIEALKKLYDAGKLADEMMK